MPPVIETHMFWAYGPLSQVERLCMRSFVQNGYSLLLWTYGEVFNAPDGVTVRNARDILPESAVFCDRAGVYAAFSDIFRYTVLRRCGGLWADTDVVALASAADLPAQPFLVMENNEDGSQKLNNNVIYNPRPSAGNFVDMAGCIAERYPHEHIYWGTIGSKLLGGIACFYEARDFAFMPASFANPVDFWKCPQALFADHEPPVAVFLHLYNEMWRRSGVDKHAPFPETSLMRRLQRRFDGL